MLNVWHDSQWVVIHLSAGDGAIFREDVWHGGASYDRQHGRVHKYWEPTDVPAGWLRADDDVDFGPGYEGVREARNYDRPGTFDKKSDKALESLDLDDEEKATALRAALTSDAFKIVKRFGGVLDHTGTQAGSHTDPNVRAVKRRDPRPVELGRAGATQPAADKQPAAGKQAP